MICRLYVLGHLLVLLDIHERLVEVAVVQEEGARGEAIMMGRDAQRGIERINAEKHAARDRRRYRARRARQVAHG